MNLLQFSGTIALVYGIVALLIGSTIESEEDFMKSKEIKKIERILTKKGCSPEKNISDFWFKNKEKINEIDHNLKDKFSLQIRWKSELGKHCKESIKDFISRNLQEHKKTVEDFLRKNPLPDAHLSKYDLSILASKPIIDFDQFSFSYKDKLYSLEDFAGSFKTSYVGGQRDLRGIDLSGIRLSTAIIKNANFVYANFYNSSFTMIDFANVNFTHSSFKNSSFVGVSFDDNSSLSNTDMTGAFINAVRGLNNKTLAIPFKFKKVSYLWLLKQTFKKIIGRKDHFIREGQHTKFHVNDVEEMSKSEIRSLKEYIKWYQYVETKIVEFEKLTLREKIGFTLSLLATKHWDSYFVLICNAFLVILFFSLLFYCLHASAFSDSLNNNFIDSFYYSFINFTSLGSGSNISPITGWAKVFVLVESLCGYTTLGLLIFLIGYKVGKLY